MATVNTYLTFNGNCEEVFNFYKSAFGGEFAHISKFKDMPSEQPLSDKDGNKVMHVSLLIGNTVLMGSDTLSSMPGVNAGNNFSIAINAESEEEAKKLFDTLSAGGNITMPLNKTFWGAYFGMFTDKFGINWMVNYDLQPQQQ